MVLSFLSALVHVPDNFLDGLGLLTLVRRKNLIYQGIQDLSILQPGRESGRYFYFWLPPMLRYPVQ